MNLCSPEIFGADPARIKWNIVRGDTSPLRVEYKNLMKKAYKSGDAVKGEFYNRRQHAYKIKLNDDYATERKHVLTNMKLHLFPESVFYEFMDRRGKLGGQAKFPRVMPDGMFSEWIHFLDESQPDWGGLD